MIDDPANETPAGMEEEHMDEALAFLERLQRDFGARREAGHDPRPAERASEAGRAGARKVTSTLPSGSNRLMADF